MFCQDRPPSVLRTSPRGSGVASRGEGGPLERNSPGPATRKPIRSRFAAADVPIFSTPVGRTEQPAVRGDVETAVEGVDPEAMDVTGHGRRRFGAPDGGVVAGARSAEDGRQGDDEGRHDRSTAPVAPTRSGQFASSRGRGRRRASTRSADGAGSRDGRPRAEPWGETDGRGRPSPAGQTLLSRACISEISCC